MNEPGHQVHERGLAGAVRPYQTGNPGRNSERDAVDPQDFAVEFGYFVEDDLGRAHRTTSTGRSLRHSTASNSVPSAAVTIAQGRAPGPESASAPTIALQTWFMAIAGSSIEGQSTRSTALTSSVAPASMKKKPRTRPPA